MMTQEQVIERVTAERKALQARYTGIARRVFGSAESFMAARSRARDALAPLVELLRTAYSGTGVVISDTRHPSAVASAAVADIRGPGDTSHHVGAVIEGEEIAYHHWMPVDGGQMARMRDDVDRILEHHIKAAAAAHVRDSFVYTDEPGADADKPETGET